MTASFLSLQLLRLLFLSVYMCRYVCVSNYTTIVPLCVSHSLVPDFLGPHGLQPASLLCPWNSPGKNAGVGSCALLQGIFPTQGSNPGLPYCRQILYRLSHQRSKRPAKRCHQLLSLDIRERFCQAVCCGQISQEKTNQNSLVGIWFQFINAQFG